MQNLAKFMLLGILATTLLVAQNIGSPPHGADEKAKKEAFEKSYTAESEGDFTTAINLLKALHDNSYETQLRLGWLFYLNKSNEESANYYQLAAEQMPNAVEPLMGLINPLYAAEKWEKLEETYLRILQIDPNNSKINYRLGTIYYYRKAYVTADPYFTKALNLYPFDYDINLMAGWNKLFLGKYPEAKALFNRVLLMSPDDPTALEGLSLIR